MKRKMAPKGQVPYPCQLASAQVMFTCDSDGKYPTALNPRYASRTPPDRGGTNHVVAGKKSMVMEMTDFLGADPAQGGIKPETSPDTGKLFSPRHRRPRPSPSRGLKKNNGGAGRLAHDTGYLVGKRHLSVRSQPLNCGAGERVGLCGLNSALQGRRQRRIEKRTTRVKCHANL